MADLNSNWKLGEYRGDNIKTIEVEYEDTLVAGDIGKITGVNADGQLLVSKHTQKTKAFCVIPAGQDGADGDVREVLIFGPIKVTFGGAINPGAPVGAQANKIVNLVATFFGCGIHATSTAANDDTGVIFFNGINPGLVES